MRHWHFCAAHEPYPPPPAHSLPQQEARQGHTSGFGAKKRDQPAGPAKAFFYSVGTNTSDGHKKESARGSSWLNPRVSSLIGTLANRDIPFKIFGNLPACSETICTGRSPSENFTCGLACVGACLAVTASSEFHHCRPSAGRNLL